LFLVVSSRNDIADMIAVIADGLGEIEQTVNAERLWRKAGRRHRDVIGVVIDFRDEIVERSRLVDRIVRGHRIPGILALIAPGECELLFDLARRGIHRWVPAPPDYESLRRELQRIAAATVVSAPAVCESSGSAVMDREEFMRATRPLAGPSEAARRLRERVVRVASANVPIVLTGESGAGKQIVAKVIHAISARRDRQFVDVNICGIAETLFESELFGSTPGAFTGAIRRKGFFLSAHEGTLFLDEIGDLPVLLQPKILKAVECGLLYPLGSDKPETVDVRLICATNRNMTNMVRAGGFRKDLWQRIASIVINVPPLRERLEDIPVIAHTLLRSLGYDKVTLMPEAILALQHHRWMGNVRELKSALERSVVISGRHRLRARDLSFDPWLGDLPEPD
jgi:DNA-binding NtrC family response regulator